jgi:hypothetical protein
MMVTIKFSDVSKKQTYKITRIMIAPALINNITRTK